MNDDVMEAQHSEKKSDRLAQFFKCAPAAIALVLALGFTGCGSSPRSTAEAFVKAIGAGKFEEAKKFTTIKMAGEIDVFSKLPQGSGQGFFKALSQGEFVQERVDGDAALVDFKVHEMNIIQSVKLNKIDGKWLVSDMGEVHR